MSTGSATGRYSGVDLWWAVDLKEIVSINRVVIYLSNYAFKNGYYKEIKVQTKKKDSDTYTLCHHIREFKTLQNTVFCDESTEGRFVQLVGILHPRGDIFYLVEVEVYEV